MLKIIKRTLKVKIILLIAVLITLSILFLSLIRVNNLPDLQVNELDKYYHCFAYFVLSLSWLSYFQVSSLNLKTNFIFLVIFALITFGIIIEVLQRALTSYRLFDHQDMIANSIGVLIATVLFLGVRKKVFWSCSW